MRVRARDGRLVHVLVGALCRSSVWVGVRVPSLLRVDVSYASLDISKMPGDGGDDIVVV
jgi:hypothetical protein